jgi:C1A family cysteine protease
MASDLRIRPEQGPSGERFGWRPDLPDIRDVPYKASRRKLPPETRLDLDPAMPECYDQGALGSCTANAIAAVVEFDLNRQPEPDFTPSRLFIYYYERWMEHSIGEDAGAYIRDGIKVMHKIGAPPEHAWPYDIGSFAIKPNSHAYALAGETKANSYAKVRRSGIRRAIADGHPVIFGFSVYESFPMQAGGLVPLPGAGERLLGGHAVVAVGYVMLGGQPLIRVRNSWGPHWGENGYYWMPLAYLTNPDLSDDFWLIRTVS